MCGGVRRALAPRAMTTSCLSGTPFPFLPFPVAMGCCGLNADSKDDAEEAKKQKQRNKEIDRMIQKDKQVMPADEGIIVSSLRNA